MTENELATIVVNLCIKIHRTLGPGLLESVYEEVLCYELRKQGLSYSRQKKMIVKYEEVVMDLGFRTDVIIEDKLLLELKSVEEIIPVHSKIALTYIRLSNIKLGLLINFSETLMKDGITRLVNKL